MTSSLTPNATSSPASAFGPTPFAAPVGPIIDLFGPIPVRANLSPRQAKALDLLISGTYGRPGTTIKKCGPPVVFGEQVASQAGLLWVDLVQTDLEAEGYAFGSVDICSAGIGSANGRQRLYLVADSNGDRCSRRPQQDIRTKESEQQAPRWGDPGRRGENALPSSIAMVGADGASRLLEPGTVPLVAGYPTLVERLRAYGNAINAEAATQFIAAYLETQ